MFSGGIVKQHRAVMGLIKSVKLVKWNSSYNSIAITINTSILLSTYKSFKMWFSTWNKNLMLYYAAAPIKLYAD